MTWRVRPAQNQETTMYPLSQTMRLGVLVASALALHACSFTDVSSYVEQGTNFTKYHSYGWEPMEARPTGDPRLDSNPFFEESVRASVDQELAAKGFEKLVSGMPDLLVRYHARVDQAINANEIDQEYAGCGEGGCQPFVYEAGSLVIDLVDARTKTLIWRGWAKGAVDGVIDNQERMEQTVDEAVGRIFAKLPPRLSDGA
jgi:hypothetical protein